VQAHAQALSGKAPQDGEVDPVLLLRSDTDLEVRQADHRLVHVARIIDGDPCAVEIGAVAAAGDEALAEQRRVDDSEHRLAARHER
jgi:hypothetical protein